jgi:excinuclease ABC subunit C
VDISMSDELIEEFPPETPEEEAEAGPAAQGVGVIRAALATLPGSPGVYRMLNARGDAVYVGKARNLKARVANYTHLRALPHRLQRMVAETRRLEVVLTHTEVEALLLESNLIKHLEPRYNIILRDDKSFPFIHLTGDTDFPLLTKHRGAQSAPGDYFGPFASVGSVNRTLIALQRAFLLRSCSDSIFTGRTRPCLLYQIKRCSAPCVGRIDKDGYAKLVEAARDFLSGRSQDVQQRFAVRMQEMSEAQHYEAAAAVRDRIRALTNIQGHQEVNIRDLGDADVIAAHQAGGQTCIQVFFFRGGQNWGNRPYYPAHARDLGIAEILGAFLGQFYEDKQPPRLILLSEAPVDADLIAAALASRAGARVELQVPQRGDKLQLVQQALFNAREALARRLAESSAQRKLLAGVAQIFGLEAPPKRIEVYDNSHIQGSNAVGGMIVAGPEGFMKNAYRKFNIRDVTNPGDDYAMMHEVLTRRFSRALKEDPGRESGVWPDLLLIDGGAGQVTAANAVLAELGINDLCVVGIAKGPDRDAGRERFFRAGHEPLSLEPRDPVLYFLQRLRDEAHRFAIGSHRVRRAKAIGVSPLDDIAGIGARRKKALLHHFGSARSVARAGLVDLERVGGISKNVAKKIYDHFHTGGDWLSR